MPGRRSEGLRRRYVPSRALEILLRGSGLTWTEMQPGVLVLRRATAATDEPATELGEIVVSRNI